MPSFSEADACVSSSRPKMSTERMESGLQAAFKDAKVDCNNLSRVDRRCRCIAHDSGRPCLCCRARWLAEQDPTVTTFCLLELPGVAHLHQATHGHMPSPCDSSPLPPPPHAIHNIKDTG